MKKMMLALCTLMISSTVMAAHGPAGCGLGSILFKDKEGLVFNVLAATFNGTSGNQTFGMSTGTLGCEDAKSATVAAVDFIDNNMMALSTDIAKGEGQTLEAYLSLLGTTKVSKAKLQASFKNIFTKDASAQKIHNNIINVIKL